MVLDIYHYIQSQKLEEARHIYYRLLPLAQAIGSPVNFPAPLKEAMRLLGKDCGSPRSPIVPVDEHESKKIKSALQYAGLL